MQANAVGIPVSSSQSDIGVLRYRTGPLIPVPGLVSASAFLSVRRISIFKKCAQVR
jgi:hypothetical protein